MESLQQRLKSIPVGDYQTLYEILLEQYGPQGWWPLIELKETEPYTGYHIADYSWPKLPIHRFEIAIGAILTQNTAWKNVETALRQLQDAHLLSPQAMLDATETKLKTAIKPSGYFNQKARKLREWCGFYEQLDGAIPSRESLLTIWGIGPETADSILLYAYAQPFFVIDNYTKRLLFALGWCAVDVGYEKLQTEFHNNLTRDIHLYQEFHALIVCHNKHVRFLPV